MGNGIITRRETVIKSISTPDEKYVIPAVRKGQIVKPASSIGTVTPEKVLMGQTFTSDSGWVQKGTAVDAIQQSQIKAEQNVHLARTIKASDNIKITVDSYSDSTPGDTIERGISLFKRYLNVKEDCTIRVKIGRIYLEVKSTSAQDLYNVGVYWYTTASKSIGQNFFTLNNKNQTSLSNIEFEFTYPNTMYDGDRIPLKLGIRGANRYCGGNYSTHFHMENVRLSFDTVDGLTAYKTYELTNHIPRAPEELF